MLAMKILGLRWGNKTPFDGQYLKEYDPERDGISPDGKPMLAHIVVTPNIEDAMKFKTRHELYACWQKSADRRPICPDGTINCPLSSFNVEIVRC